MKQSERAEVAARLHSAAIRLLRGVRQEDARSGLSAARLSALSVLVFGGPRTVGELASAEQVSAPTMTRLLSGLESDGYIRREPSPTDGRSVIIRPTRKAVATLEKGRLRRVQHMMKLLEDLSEEEWAELGAAVERVHRALAR